MEIHNQSFVTLSDLFDGLPTLEDLFKEADHSKISWGGNDRTLISPTHFDLWHALMRADLENQRRLKDAFGHILQEYVKMVESRVPAGEL